MNVGMHILCDMFGGHELESRTVAEDALLRGIEACGATLLNLYVHEFTPAGISAVATLAESHIAVHTWPEHDLVTADAFTCGEADPQLAIDELLRAYAPERFETHRISRAVERRAFVEHEPGSPLRIVYDDATRIYDDRSEHQRIAVFERASIGRVLALADIVQVAEIDAYVYHELLAHPALAAHPHPVRVAVVGGGDGMLVREILRHPSVEAVDVFELDPRVVDVARRFLGTWKPDPRVQTHFGDAYDALEPNAYDVVLADIPDPLGQAERLFEEDFFMRAHRALKSTGGVFAMQCESLHFHPAVVRGCVEGLRSTFENVGVVQGAMATYPGAWWTFSVASTLDTHPSVARGHAVTGTRLYHPEAHGWYFIPPVVLDRLLEQVVGV
jgi:spermidine synthase